MKIYETQEYLKEVYDKTGFFCIYSQVHQVEYSQAQRCYYSFVIGRKMAEVGLAKKGRVSMIDDKQVFDWFENGTII